MKTVPACTIVTNSYLPLARVLESSYREHHPGAPTAVCVVDEPHPEVDYSALPFNVVFARDLGIASFPSFCFRYDPLELCTAVKPFFLKYLRDELGWSSVFYFDPDILVLDELEDLANSLADATMVLTPHLLAPVADEFCPSERFIRVAGVYNLGFLGLQLDDRTAAFLDWWGDRLTNMCVAELTSGLHVDQCWLDFAPSYLDGVRVLRNPRFNVAYWNLTRRHIIRDGSAWKVDGQPLGFFHFSGISLDRLNELSRHQNRIDLELLPWLRPLFEEYKQKIESADLARFKEMPYSYANFRPNGITIPQFIRSLLHETDPCGRRWPDPFSSEGAESFYEWIRRPFTLGDHRTNRVALSLRQNRSDIREAFPEVPGPDLESYRLWLLDASSRPYVRLPRQLLAPLAHDIPEPDPEFRVYADFPVRAPTFPASLEDDWGPSAWADAELVRCAALDLGNPGEAIPWLNQPVPDSGDGELRTTRLGTLLYRRRAGEAQRLASPTSPAGGPFRSWLAEEAKTTYALHPELVLPLRSFTASGLRAKLDRLLHSHLQHHRTAPAATITGLPAAQIPPHPNPDHPPAWGINLVYPAPHPELESPLIIGTATALEQAGFGLSHVPLIRPLPQLDTARRVAFPGGVPYPLTLVTGSLRSAVDMWSDFSTPARADTYTIGYWDSRDIFEFEKARNLAEMVHEIWLTDTGDVDRVHQLTGLQATVVPPPVLAPSLPEDGERPADSSEPKPFRWYAHYRAESARQLSDLAYAIARISLHRECEASLTVDLDAERAILESVREDLAVWDWVEVHQSRRSRTRLRRLVDCDALIDLHDATPVETPVLAAALGRLLVGRPSSSLTAFCQGGGALAVPGDVQQSLSDEDLPVLIDVLDDAERVAEHRAAARSIARSHGVDRTGRALAERLAAVLRRRCSGR